MRKRYAREIRCKQFEQTDFLKISGSTATAQFSPNSTIQSPPEAVIKEATTSTAEGSPAKGFSGNFSARRGLQSLHVKRPRKVKDEKSIDPTDKEERFISKEKLGMYGDQVLFEELLKPQKRKEGQEGLPFKTPFLYQDFRDSETVSSIS